MHFVNFRNILILFVLLLRSGWLIADSADSPSETKQRISLAYSSASHSGNGSQIIVSRMLSALAGPKALNPNKRPAIFEVNISYRKTIDTLVHLSGGASLKYVGQLSDYNGIDLSGFLLPDSVEIRVKAPDGRGLSLSTVKLNEDSCSFSASLKAGIQVGSVEVTRLIYSEEAWSRFEKAMVSVNYYTAWDKLLPFLSSRNQVYSDYCLDEFVDWYIMTIRSKKGSMLSGLDNPRFRGQDPANLAERSKRFEGDCYRRWLQLEKLPCTKSDNDFFSHADIAKFRLVNDIKELMSSPYYTDPHAHSLLQELAVMDNNNGPSDDSLSFSRLSRLICRGCDSATFNQFIDENIGLLTDSLRLYLQRERYSDAEIWGQNLKTLAEIRGQGQGIDKAYQLLSEVHNGILDSWLKVATKALRLGSLDMSVRYINLASEYARKHPRTLIAGDAIKSVITALVDTSLNRAQKLRGQNQSERALAILDLVIPMVDSLNQYTRKDQLKMVYCLIAQDHYDQLLNRSLSLISTNKIGAGAGLADEALQYRFENREVLTKRGEEGIILKHLALYKVDTLLKRSYPNAMLGRLVQVLDSAYNCFNVAAPLKCDTLYPSFSKLVLQFSRVFPDSINALIDRDEYSLATYWVDAIRLRVPEFVPFSDSAVVSSLNASLEELESGACVMSRDAFQRNLMKAEDLSVQGRYREASQFSAKAATHLAAVLTCRADTSVYFLLNRKYGSRWNFSNRQFLMDSLMRQGALSEALPLYDTLYQQRKRSSLLMTEFYMKSEEELITSYQNPILTDTLVRRMINRDQPESVFSALESLKQNGMVDSLSFNIQTFLGESLAKPFTEETSKEEIVALMKGYKMGDSYYRKLRDTFLEKLQCSSMTKRYLKIRAKY